MQRSVSYAFASKATRLFVHRNLHGKGKLRTAPSTFNLCWERRAFTSDDYREKLSRNGKLHDIKLDEAVDLFSEMVKSRPFPSIIEFSKLLSVIAKMKRFDVVISLGEQMQKFGISHDLYTYNILINCFGRHSQLSLALAILGKMMKLGYDPDIVTLSSILNGYCHGNRISDHIVAGVCSKEELQKALAMLEKLQKSVEERILHIFIQTVGCNFCCSIREVCY